MLVVAPSDAIGKRELERQNRDFFGVCKLTSGKLRSNAQNNFHWSQIVPAFEKLGYERFSEWFELTGRSPKESAHNVIKQMFLEPMRFDLPDGKFVDVWPSSADLTPAQFSEMDDKAERYLNTLGIYLPAREENANGTV